MDTIHTLAKRSSRKQIPALFKKIPWRKGQNNLDWGGGKYDDATNWLMDQHGVRNMVVDKFNRSQEHNDAVLVDIMTNCEDKRRRTPYVHTATLANVLNVIPDQNERIELLTKLALYIQPFHTTIYISCYNATGQPSFSQCQTCMKLEEYLPEIQQVFNPWVNNPHDIAIVDDMIVIFPRERVMI